MRKSFTLLLILILVALVQQASSQEREIVVGDVETPSLRWGSQPANVELTNKTDYVKFVVIEAEVTFSDSYLGEPTVARTNHVLEPKGHTVVHPDIVIPANYGRAKMTMRLHDVVDTLDAILPHMQFYEQPFSLSFYMPDAMMPYMQEKITLPPRVDQHKLFSNEFRRALLLLLNDGKTTAEIAKMAVATPAFVESECQLLIQEGLAGMGENGYRPLFAVLTTSDAEKGRALAEEVAMSLAEIISKNIPGYRDALKDLINAAAISPDSNDFISGSSLLYKPYPVISGMLIWHHLGSQFVTGADPFLIYENTDLCNAAIGPYMYVVQGGAFLNGNHFYAELIENNSMKVLFADNEAEFWCPANFERLKKVGRKARWRWERTDLPEFFVLDTAAVRPLVERMAVKTGKVIESAREKVDALIAEQGQSAYERGYRYWFWNVAASLTLRKLTDSGALVRQGNGKFEFDLIEKK